MTTNDSTDVSHLEWNTNPVSFAEVAETCPTLARIVKGHYMNIGVQKLPLSRLQQDVFLHSSSNSVKVFGHSVRVRAETKSKRLSYAPIPLDQRLSIPLTYRGWFEILSEDGKAAKPLESVHHLAKKNPQKCIIRQDVKGYLSTDKSKVNLQKPILLLTGEVVTLVDTITNESSETRSNPQKYLRVKTSKSELVCLSFEQQGMFTPVAGKFGISGVHTIRDIIVKFRLPLTVKLTQGVWPKVDRSRFTGVIRLDWAYHDNIVFVCPLLKDNLRMLPVPINTPLKMNVLKNLANINDSEFYQNMTQKCNKMLANYNNTIHVVTSVSDTTVLTRDNSNMLQKLIARKDSNLDMDYEYSAKDAKLFDEIDDIYQYVRDGGVPPKLLDDLDCDEGIYENIDDYVEKDDKINANIKLGNNSPTDSHVKATNETHSNDTGCDTAEFAPEAVDKIIPLVQSTSCDNTKNSAQIEVLQIEKHYENYKAPNAQTPMYPNTTFFDEKQTVSENITPKSYNKNIISTHMSTGTKNKNGENLEIRKINSSSKIKMHSKNIRSVDKLGVKSRSTEALSFKRIEPNNSIDNPGEVNTPRKLSTQQSYSPIKENIDQFSINKATSPSVTNGKYVKNKKFSQYNHNQLQFTESAPYPMATRKVLAPSGILTGVNVTDSSSKLLATKQISTSALNLKPRRKSLGFIPLTNLFHFSRSKVQLTPRPIHINGVRDNLVITQHRRVSNDRVLTISGVPTSSSSTDVVQKGDIIYGRHHGNTNNNKTNVKRNISQDIDKTRSQVISNGAVTPEKLCIEHNSVSSSTQARVKLRSMHL